MKPVLFTSNRPLLRAENIRAVFDVYDGDKVFIQTNPWKSDPRLSSSEFSLRVCDEFIGASPGKSVMIGHAISGGKTYGLDQIYPYHRKENAELLTYVVASGKEMVPVVARQSGVPEERVLPLGVPRTDVYIGACKGDGGTFLAGKRAYLYAPTFRNREETPMSGIHWELIDRVLTDDEVFVVKPHMVTGSILKGRSYRHIVEVSPGLASTPYLMDCDVLITDYSSIMFDAHLLRKPVILFEKVCGYLQTRGMYLDYPSGYASRYCTDEMELVNIMRDAKKQGAEDIACMELTAGACDGHARQRIIDLIRSMV